MAAVGLALDDELVAAGDEPVDRGLRQERVAHDADPLRGVAVAGDDGRAFVVAFDDELVEVAVCIGSIAWRAKPSRMSSSIRASLRISASLLLSRRAALSRRKSWSARLNRAVLRRRIAMCPRAVARWVLPTPTVIHGF